MREDESEWERGTCCYSEYNSSLHSIYWTTAEYDIMPGV